MPVRNRARDIRLAYQAREGEDFTMTKIAFRLRLSRTTLSLIEDNKRQPSAATLSKMCAYYGCQPGDLLYYI